MTQYDNSNTGAIFKNDRKETEKHPDYRGSAEIVCPYCTKTSHFWMSSWLKTAKQTGQRFMSFSFSAKDENRKPNPANTDVTDDSGNVGAPFDDSIPF